MSCSKTLTVGRTRREERQGWRDEHRDEHWQGGVNTTDELLALEYGVVGQLALADILPDTVMPDHTNTPLRHHRR